MSKSKAIGTKAETATAKAARRLGFPNADRHVLKGSLDEGDVWLTPLGEVVAEVKGGEMARSASDNQIDLWLAETLREKQNAGAEVAFLVVQRRAVGEANAHRWWAFMPLPDLARLVSKTYDEMWRWNPIETHCSNITVRMTLEEMLQTIRAAGFGESL